MPYRKEKIQNFIFRGRANFKQKIKKILVSQNNTICTKMKSTYCYILKNKKKPQKLNSEAYIT